jgi:hypothetical protein
MVSSSVASKGSVSMLRVWHCSSDDVFLCYMMSKASLQCFGTANICMKLDAACMSSALSEVFKGWFTLNLFVSIYRQHML